MRMNPLRPMTEQEKLKYEAATELGLLDRLLEVGWGGLTAGETGQIGGRVAQMRRRDS